MSRCCIALVLLAACGNTGGGASGDDMADSDAASGDGANGASPCTVTDDSATCNSRSPVDVTYGSMTRRVWWATPTGTPPASGWPAVVLYQGTNAGPALTWDKAVATSTPFGGYFQVVLVAHLVDHGFVVIQPEAKGGNYWYTNVPFGDYDTSPDGAFIPKLLDAIGDGTFGSVDTTHLYATGISSGGYMTSRMAVSYPGKFRALAIAAGSYATCLGSSCTVPSTMPADHPPTLFLHGEVDTTVPIDTARDYEAKLEAAGKTTKFVADPDAGHEWLDVAPAEITAWFTP